MTEYLDAIETHIATLEDDKKIAATQWVTWARGHLATQSPLDGLAMPPDPEPTPDAIKPFMKGHSPYGPDRTYGW